MKLKLLLITLSSLYLFTSCYYDSEDELENIEISLSTSKINAPPEGGIYKIAVTSNVGWIVDEFYADWFSIKNRGSSISDTIIIEVTRSNSETAKTKTVSVRNGYVVDGYIVSENLTITQAGWDVPAEGVLISGTIWAKYNVDAFGTFAESPYHFGKYYQYNDIVAYTTVVYDELYGYRRPYPDWQDVPVVNNWLPENNPCPPGWRLPTSGELWDLLKSGYTYNASLNGYFFGLSSASATPENTKGCIFMPASGRISGGNVMDVFQQGYYWAQDGYGLRDGHIGYICLSFKNDGESVRHVTGTTNQKDAFSIRCVKE